MTKTEALANLANMTAIHAAHKAKNPNSPYTKEAARNLRDARLLVKFADA